MGFYINPGNDSFRKVMNSKIYVDKTELISYTNSVLDTEQMYLCISRPRRFGKSMAAKMLAAYYCRTCDSRKLFQNLKITQDESFEKHLNQYDVLFLNMQSFLSQAEDAEHVTDYLQEVVLEDLQEEYGEGVNLTGCNLIRALSKIYVKTGTSFIFIIDEWDCIFREKKNATAVQTKYLDFLRALLKDMPYVKLAYMTGILPIKKYGTHSALNMFSEFSMTEPKLLAEYIGFTEPEVQQLCETYKMDFDEIKTLVRWVLGSRRIAYLQSQVCGGCHDEPGIS